MRVFKLPANSSSAGESTAGWPSERLFFAASLLVRFFMQVVNRRHVSYDDNEMNKNEQIRGVVLFDAGAGEDDDLVGQKIYFDIFGFVAPDTAFDVQGVIAVVRLAQKGGNFAVFHPHLQFVVIILGDPAAASQEQSDQQRQQEYLHFSIHQLLHIPQA